MNFAIACVTSILCMLGTTSLMEQNKTEKVVTAIEQQQEQQEKSEVNNYGTYNHYEADEIVVNNEEELLNIKDQLNEIKKDISNSERNAKVITYNEKEQKYTSCDQCGEYGAANTDLFKWRDTKGCYHWTHYNCLEDYIARTGNSPTDKITTNHNND